MDEDSTPAEREPYRIFPLLAGVAGALILADSVSQVAHAVAPWDPGSAGWRATALRLLFTQVTPVVVAVVLLTLGFAGAKPDRWRWAGRIVALAAVLVAALALAWWLAFPGSLEGLEGPALLAQRRAALQALVSAAALAIGLAAIAAVVLRVPRPPAD